MPLISTYKKPLLIGVGLLIVIIGVVLFFLRPQEPISPLPPETGVRVIFVTPNPDGLENIAPPSEEIEEKASPSASLKARATPKATVAPKSSAAASPKASNAATPRPTASP